jgi:hypothetical protein
MINKLILMLLTLMVSGCARTGLFSDIRNDHVGSNKDLVIHPLSLVEIVPYNDKLDKYICKLDGGCKWAYFVAKQTGEIKSWEYISSSDKCQTGLDWMNPW